MYLKFEIPFDSLLANLNSSTHVVLPMQHKRKLPIERNGQFFSSFLGNRQKNAKLTIEFLKLGQLNHNYSMITYKRNTKHRLLEIVSQDLRKTHITFKISRAQILRQKSIVKNQFFKLMILTSQHRPQEDYKPLWIIKLN